MSRLIFILLVCFGSLIAGYLAQVILLKSRLLPYPRIKKASDRVKIVTLLFLLPIPILNSFWKITFTSGTLLIIPFLGLLSFLVGGASAIALIRLFHVEPSRAASVFVCGMFTNLGIFGGFIGFVLFRDLGFLLVQLFTMFEVFTYYVIGFPLSYQISRGGIASLRFNFAWIKEQPAAFVPVSAIILGSLLKVFAVPRPEAVGALSSFLIPAITALLGCAIGITLRFSRVARYKREIAMILAIKFVMIPLVNIPLAAVVGMGRIFQGVPLKMIAILSFMPVAFIALVPPALYDFDLDLANSGWLVTTLSILIIFPVLYFIIL